MKPIPSACATRPLLAAMLVCLALAACQREQDDIMTTTTPSDDVAAATPVDMTPVDTTPVDTATPPPMQPIDPCAQLMGAELDECLRRQTTQPAPPPSEQLSPTQDLPPGRSDTPPRP